MLTVKRNNVVVRGSGKKLMLFSHGFGCDQNMWRLVAPAFENDYKVVLFDHVGAGASDLTSYDPVKYSTLEGYADDIIDLMVEMDFRDAIFVGHSVSAMIGALVSVKAPKLFSSIIMVGPSPCYINDSSYVGGFTQDQVEDLLESLDNNHLGWSMSMAPVIMGNNDQPELGQELANSFCRMEPGIARQFARTTFLSDKREVLPFIKVPVLILQCSEDVIAPLEVGQYMLEQIPDATMVVMEATGHCPNLSAPEETIDAIKKFLA